MDIEINELHSNVRTADSQALLDPKVMEQIVRMVMREMKEHHMQETRSKEERQLAPGASARPAQSWE